MPEIDFEERAVAFIDILGFSNLVNEATSDAGKLAELKKIVSLLSSAIPQLDSTVDTTVPIHLIPKHLYVSDCVILSAPLCDVERKNYNGLETVTLRTIQLTHQFLRAGYLIRGGLAIGPTWHDERNIIGSGYQEALEIEKNGDQPCVTLSENAQEYWTKGWCATSTMCIPHGDQLIVNGLCDFYMPEYSVDAPCRDTTMEVYDAYEKIVDDMRAEKLSQRAKDKWGWFKTQLNDQRKRI